MVLDPLHDIANVPEALFSPQAIAGDKRTALLIRAKLYQTDRIADHVGGALLALGFRHVYAV